MSLVAEAIKQLRQMRPTEHVAVAIWVDEDVTDAASRLGVTLTPEEVEKVLDLVDRKWDSMVGINWDVIDYYILEVVKHRLGKASAAC